MYQNNNKIDNWGGLTFTVGFTKKVGGFISVQATHDAAPGGEDSIIDKVEYTYAWEDNNGTEIYCSEGMTVEVFSEEFGEVVFSRVLRNIEEIGGNGSFFRLVVSARTLISSPDRKTWVPVVWRHVTSFTSNGLPCPLTALPLSQGQTALIGGNTRFVSTIDPNGTDTQYDAVFSSPDEQVAIIIDPQYSNEFTLSLAGEQIFDINHLSKWKARAENSIGRGEWSEWCEFKVSSKLLGTFYAPTITGDPSGRLHTINTEFGYTGEADSVICYWELSRTPDCGETWEKIGGVKKGFTAVWSDLPNAYGGNIYNVLLNVLEQVGETPSSTSFSEYCAYEFSETNEPIYLSSLEILSQESDPIEARYVSI